MRAYGWSEDGVSVVGSEAAVLEELAEGVLAGLSLRSLAAGLNERGVLSVSGKPWLPLTIRRALVNPRIVGRRRGVDGELVVSEVEPILSVEVWERLCEVLEDPRRKAFAPKGVAGQRLVGVGGVMCGRCGRAMNHKTVRGRGEYVCSVNAGGCGLTITARLVEPRVEAGVLARLADGPWRAGLAGAVNASPSVVEDRIAELEERKGQLLVEFAGLGVSADQVRAGVARADELIGEARVELARARAVNALPEPSVRDVARWWAGAPVTPRREVVAIVLDHVTVAPKRGRTSPSDSVQDRLRFFWR